MFTLLKRQLNLFDGFRCHLLGTLAGCSDTLHYSKKGDFVVERPARSSSLVNLEKTEQTRERVKVVLPLAEVQERTMASQRSACWTGLEC